MRVFYQQDPGVPEARLACLLEQVLQAEGRQAELSLIVVSDDRIAQLHEDFMQEPGPTDVIAFPLAEGPDDPFLGEVYASWDTARREAAERGLPAQRELALYAVHGTLHLLGYDDHEPSDRARMHARQEELLESFWRGLAEFDSGAGEA